MADYLDATRIRALAAELGIKPSKGRGQNFLFDANTVRRIVNLARLEPDEVVLEIGPGLGSLTLGLLHTGAHVVAVEIESALARRLPRTIAELAPDEADHLTVIEADALHVGVDDLVSDARDVSEAGSVATPGFTTATTPTDHAPRSTPREPTALVANLPYNISVPVILHTLATFPSIRHGLVMVQSEVADRLVAKPGSKVYGVPSAKLAWHADAARVGSVPATVFWPAPNVESGLVRFTRHDPLADTDRAATFALVDRAFSQRRKMLRSVLAGAYGPEIVDALTAAGISPQARGETLSITDFARLARLVDQHS